MAHRLQPAQPLATRFVFALPRQLARRTDPPAVGVQPQTDQKLRIGVLASRVALHGSDLRVIQTQIQPPDQLPNPTHAVLWLYQLLNIHGAQQQLPPIDRYQSRNTSVRAVHARTLHTATSSAVSISSHVPVPGSPISPISKSPPSKNRRWGTPQTS